MNNEHNFSITPYEKKYVRELAYKQKEYAERPITKEREKLWYLHNSLQGKRPMIVMETITFWENICPPLQCESSIAREMENQLLKSIVNEELIGDDKVVPGYYALEVELDYRKYGIDSRKVYDKNGIGFHIESVLELLEQDFGKLSPSVYAYDKEHYRLKKEFIESVIGDILPVELVNSTNYWDFSITQQVVELMGMENMFYSMYDEPDLFHELMQFITQDKIRLLRWEEEHSCLWLNNHNHYMGGGSYCFTEELPQKDFTGKVRSIDTWGHMNSQESVGISPDMFQEFILPYMKTLSKEFGMLYYGCCEPVSDFWNEGIEQIENLRKVSISPWCKEAFMAERLSGRDIIYSRKPSPNFLGIQSEFQEEEFRAYIQETVNLTKECKSEYIFRDIYQLYGNIDKVKRAVQVVRELTEYHSFS